MDEGLSPPVRGNRGDSGRDIVAAWLSRVYPRLCGGTAAVFAPIRCRIGSIPACAGEPCQRQRVPSRLSRVYPRLCGGTRTSGNTRRHAHGSIPACAGEPGSMRSTRALEPPGSIPACAGEPEPYLLRAVISGGSIPACAGEPGPSVTGILPRSRFYRVYPRLCGGTESMATDLRAASRVYPRLCGGTTAISGQRRDGDKGSIPACAGEPILGYGAAKSTPGLSPPVRGNQALLKGRVLRAGSIPACAGEPTMNWGGLH